MQKRHNSIANALSIASDILYIDTEYGSGHEVATVLLPGFAISDSKTR